MLPNGWSEYDPCTGNSNRPVQCDNCQWKGFEDDVPDGVWGIKDICERVDGGMIVPVGVCPAIIGDYSCGSLVYYTDVQIMYRPAPTILDKIVEATS